MELNIRQTRGMVLAGAVPLPQGFPRAASITIEDGYMCHAYDERRDGVFVCVVEKSGLHRSKSRIILLENVAAIFFAGVWEGAGDQRVFKFAEPDAVNDLEQGEWFLKHDLDPRKMADRMKIDVSRLDSGARGIVFVPRDAPVITIDEYVRQASAFSDEAEGCD